MIQSCKEKGHCRNRWRASSRRHALQRMHWELCGQLRRSKFAVVSNLSLARIYAKILTLSGILVRQITRGVWIDVSWMDKEGIHCRGAV